MSHAKCKRDSVSLWCRWTLKSGIALLLLLLAAILRPAVSVAAITVTTLDSGAYTGSVPTYYTNSFTPTANTVILTVVESHLPGKPGTPTLVGNNLVWNQVSQVLWKGGDTPDDKITVFTATGASPQTGKLEIRFTLNQNHVLWTILQLEGAELGPNPVVQSVTKSSETGTSMSIPIGTPARGSNVIIGCFSIDSDKGITAGAEFASSPLVVGGGPNRSLLVEWKVPGGITTAVNATFGDNKPAGGIALEIGAGIVTTLGSGADGQSATIAPGVAAVMADSFTLKTDRDTGTVTDMTVALSAGTSGAIGQVKITGPNGSPLYGSVTDPGDTPKIVLSQTITTTTTETPYEIWIAPKGHLAMPAPPGSTYAVRAYISNWTDVTWHQGSDTGATVVTIDNLSPANVTNASLNFTLANASLSWTNPADSDLGSMVVLRRVASAVADAPVEGATYSVGNAIGNSVVACVVATPATSCSDTGSTTGEEFSYGITHYYKIFTRDTNGNYSPAGVAVGSFIPHRYQPDAMIWSEGAGAFLSAGVYESTAATQVGSIGRRSGVTAAHLVRFKNSGSGTDSIKVTGTGSAPGFTVEYLDGENDRTNAVTGAGYLIADLAVGGYTEWAVNVTPAGGTSAVLGGASYNVSVTATSVTDNTKTDQVRAATFSTSSNITLQKNSDKGAYKPGEDITFTTVASNSSSITNAASVVLTDNVPPDTGFKIGGAVCNAGTSSLTCTVSYSNGSFGYTPVSGGCSAPAGYDYCVKEVKWTMSGSMAAGSSFTCSLVVGVK